MMRIVPAAVLWLVIACHGGSDHAKQAGSGPAVQHPARVVAPSTGTVWVEGQTYLIRWENLSWDKVHISAAVGGKDKGHLAFNYPARVDSLTWTVPAGFVTGFGPASSNQVRIRLEDAADPTRFVESAAFTVRGDTAAQ
jgi:hypothetical protein